jgi:hypothetical protein
MLDLIITSILPSCSPAAQKSRGSWSLALRRIAHAFRSALGDLLRGKSCAQLINCMRLKRRLRASDLGLVALTSSSN